MRAVYLNCVALVLYAASAVGWSSSGMLPFGKRTKYPDEIIRLSDALSTRKQRFRMSHCVHSLPSKAEVQNVLTSFRPVLGVEAHVQLNTQRKAFCHCSSSYLRSAPNTNICPICIAEPGTLPVPNPKMVELGARLAMALKCEVSHRVTFDRKHYFYPDTPKNYQITQQSNPIGREGCVVLPSKEMVGISRVQIEEDAAKIVYADSQRISNNMVDSEYALLDFNRAGVALLEIVSKPDIRSAEQAVEFAKEIQAMCRYMNISNGNMEDGSLRLDVNLSLEPKHQRPVSSAASRVEIKNLNSFRAMQHVIEYEIVRQARLLSAGKHIRTETRMWDEFTLQSTPLRAKPASEGYRMSIEPNIPAIDISRHLVSWQSQQVELPNQKRQRYCDVLGLTEEQTRLLTRDPATSRFFEEAVAQATATNATEIASWIVGVVEGQLRAANATIADTKLTPASLTWLVQFVRDGTLTLRMAKQILPALMNDGADVHEYIKSHDCFAITDRDTIEQLVMRALQGDDDKVKQYNDGAKRLLGYFVGKVMNEAGGRAEPNAVHAILEEVLTSKSYNPHG